MALSRWRVIRDGAHDGFTQMAVDEAMLELARESQAVWLRLYRFHPPALSLGRAQPLAGIYLPGLREIGADLVRRPSGGQAVLHDDELTYALAAPLSVIGGSVTESYRQIAEALRLALAKLGVKAELSTGQPLARPDRADPNCFVSPTAYELTIGGKKAVGSAQVRRRGVLLQHGALPRTLDFERWSACFAPPGAERLGWQTAMEARAVGLFSHLPAERRPSDQDLADAVVAGLSEHFGTAFASAELPAATRRLAEAMRDGAGPIQ